MIEVRFDKTIPSLKVMGHAGSEEYGRDLICAGASTLVWTLAENIRYLEMSGYLRSCDIRVGRGDAFISCDAKQEYRAQIGRIFESICVGFEILADKYPDFISYRLEGWN